MQEAPASVTLTTSSLTCSLSGDPQFTATTRYLCTASKPIWAPVSLFLYCGNGSQIPDPLRNHRKIGARSTIIWDEYGREALELENTELVRLEPGQKFSTSYTVSVVPKAGGLRDSDTRHMVSGNTYEITLMNRRWRWMFEDEMEQDMDEDERREILKKREVTEWSVDCQATSKAL